MSGAAPPAVWAEETGAPGAPLVVLIHGTMDRSTGLRRLARRLVATHRVLSYDRRGYGRSVAHDGPFGLDAHVDDLLGLLEGRPAAYFGHSYGGNVALALAARHPALVRSVVVYETPLTWLEWWPGSSAGAMALATAGDPADAAERFLRRMLGDAKWERLPARTRAARRAEGPALVGELSDLRRGPPWSPEQITAPVMAMFGEHCAAHHRAAMEYLGAVLPDARPVMVAGARHAGPNTHPDVVAAIVTAFIAA